MAKDNWLEITLGAATQIAKDAGLTGTSCIWGTDLLCDWSVTGSQLKIINKDTTGDVFIVSGTIATLYGVKTLATGSSANTTDCKIAGAGGDIATKATTFTHIILDTSATSTRKLTLGNIKSTFFYIGGKGVLSFTSSYTDQLDTTSKITYDLGADYGSELVCSVTINK